MEEIWKEIKGFESRYEVSNMGRVRSLSTIRTGKNGCLIKMEPRILSPGPNKYGYFRVILSSGSKKLRKSYALHRIVAQAFIPNISGKETVNHINRDKSDNRVENLEWCTHLENAYHYEKTKGRDCVGVKYFKHTKRWCAMTYTNGKYKSMGIYGDTKQEAYDKKVAYFKEKGIENKYF